jgi:hypothetical protein
MWTEKPDQNWNVVLESVGDEIFVVVNGLKIAKRGQPGTPHAGTWIPIEPGWEVLSSADDKELAISQNGTRIH